MRVTRIELTNLRTNRDVGTYTGELTFFLSDGKGGPTHTTSLNCRTLMLGVENREQMHAGLVRDALRQLQWMPEVRFGTVSLTDLPEVTERIQSDRAA